jgi:hypothetical protein
MKEIVTNVRLYGLPVPVSVKMPKGDQAAFSSGTNFVPQRLHIQVLRQRSRAALYSGIRWFTDLSHHIAAISSTIFNHRNQTHS